MTTVVPDSPQNQAPIHSISELVEYFHRGAKPPSSFRVGLEHEKIGFAQLPGGRFVPLPYSDLSSPSIVDLFRELTKHGYTPLSEHGNVIALNNPKGSVTLEPGGQFEFSGAPKTTALEAITEMENHLKELLPLADSLGILFVQGGFRPLGLLGDVPKIPKDRYHVMRVYLPKQGSLGLEMMHRTATVQANLDYSSEADAAEKMKIGFALAPLVTALFAASPFKDGKPSGYQSVRAACWLDTDNRRCGILPFIFQTENLFLNYTNWALDVPMFFVYRNHTYHEVESFTFRQFLQKGFQGQPATMNDWDLHLSTLFPEARLRHYIEFRSADSGPLSLVKALPCFWRGLLYAEGARQEALNVVASWDYDELTQLRTLVPQHGIHMTFRNRPLVEIGKQLIQIASQGLLDLGALEEQKLLEPLFEIIDTKRSAADHMLSLFEENPEDPTGMLTALRYR